MKHVRDPDEWQHESMFTCLNCKKLIEFNSMLDGRDGPDDCLGMEMPFEKPVEPREIGVDFARKGTSDYSVTPDE